MRLHRMLQATGPTASSALTAACAAALAVALFPADCMPQSMRGRHMWPLRSLDVRVRGERTRLHELRRLLPCCSALATTAVAAASLATALAAAFSTAALSAATLSSTTLATAALAPTAATRRQRVATTTATSPAA